MFQTGKMYLLRSPVSAGGNLRRCHSPPPILGIIEGAMEDVDAKLPVEQRRIKPELTFGSNIF